MAGATTLGAVLYNSAEGLTTQVGRCRVAAAGWGVAGAALVLALGVYGFVTAIGGQRLIREGVFGDE